MTTEARAFGRYELRGTLGQGGFATVYRAYDPLLAREVALKALLPHLAADGEIRDRFVAEARTLAALRHPNVVTVFDVGEENGRPYFAMELVAGETLAAQLAAGPPPRASTLRWLTDLASALDYLHAAGVVHRDVKPANVLIEGSGRAVLMDLGIARSIDSTSHTLAGTSLGTPAYMAPEQVRGQIAGPPADIYALGILAFQLLAGRPPFSGDTAHVLHAQVYDAPPLEGLPPAVAAALGSALAKEPAERSPSASAFVTALNEAERADPTVYVSDSAQWYAPRTTPPPPPLPQAPIGAGPEPWRTPLPSRRAGVATRAFALGGGLMVVLVFFAVAIAVALTRGHSTTNANQANSVVVPTASVAAIVPATAITTAPATAAASSTARATAGAASATAAPAPPSATAPAPPVIPTSAVTALTVDNTALQAWAAGQGPLSVTTSFAGAPGGATLVMRVSPADDPADPVGQSAPVALGASDGDELVSIPRLAPGALPSGNYLLLAYIYGADGQWVAQTRTRGLAVTPNAVPTRVPTQQPQPTQPPVAPNLPSAPSLAYSAAATGSSRVALSDVEPLGAPVGGVFSFTVSASNDGAATSSGSISVSSPDATQIAVGPAQCNAGGQTSTSLPAGQRGTVYAGANQQPGTAPLSYPLAELDFSSLPANPTCTVRFTVTAQPGATTLRLLLRISVRDANGSYPTWPANLATTDQQGYPVILWTVPLH